MDASHEFHDTLFHFICPPARAFLITIRYNLLVEPPFALPHQVDVLIENKHFPKSWNWDLNKENALFYYCFGSLYIND